MSEEIDLPEPLFVTPIGAPYSVNDIAEALARNGVSHGKAHARVRIYAKAQLIKTRAKELIAEEMALRDIRKSRALTQEQVAKRLGGKQVYVSRMESRSASQKANTPSLSPSGIPA